MNHKNHKPYRKNLYRCSVIKKKELEELSPPSDLDNLNIIANRSLVVPPLLPGSGKPLNDNERRLIQNFAENPNQSINQSRSGTGIGNRKAHKLLSLPPVQAYLRELFKRAGITDDLLAQRLYEGLQATAQREHVINGELIQGECRPDFEQRGKYLDRALELQGFSSSKSDNSNDGNKVSIINALQIIIDRDKNVSPVKKNDSPPADDDDDDNSDG